jgi:hypothetical protein
MSPSSRRPGNRRPHLHGLRRMPPSSRHPGNRRPYLHGQHRHILDAGVPVPKDNAKFHHIIFVDGVSVPMGDATRGSHGSTITRSINGGFVDQHKG